MRYLLSRFSDSRNTKKHIMSLDLGELARQRDDPPPYENIRENVTNETGGSTLDSTPDITGTIPDQTAETRPTELPIAYTIFEQPTSQPPIIHMTESRPQNFGHNPIPFRCFYCNYLV